MNPPLRSRGWRWGWICAAVCTLAACGPPPPIRIGFLGGLSDRASSVSEDARNGVMLAIEQRNASGGVAGRLIELVVQDYGLGLDQAAAAFQALLEARVDTVIGSYPSAVAFKVLPLADQARMLLLSPTVSAVSLAGRDDYMVRLNRTTRDSARAYAQMLWSRGHQRMALAKDMRNAAFSTSWSEDFRAAFTALGGVVVADASFGQDEATSFEAALRTMLADQPDGLMFIASAADTARLAQQAAKFAPALPMAATDWASNTSLIELGGHAVEGMLIAQGYKVGDDAPRFRSFQAAYLARFGREPTDSAIASHDAVTVLAEAMSRAGKAESARDAVLRHGPYEGLQQTIRFDRFGDATRTAYFTVVRHGHFEMLP